MPPTGKGCCAKRGWDLTWTELRERGFEDYVEVLGGLGELGLRPPVAPMEGPNLAARLRGRAILRRLLQERKQKS
jgi:hypothetical protein